MLKPTRTDFYRWPLTAILDCYDPFQPTGPRLNYIDSPLMTLDKVLAHLEWYEGQYSY